MKETNHFKVVVTEMHFLKRATCSLALEGNPLACAFPCPSREESLLLMSPPLPHEPGHRRIRRGREAFDRTLPGRCRAGGLPVLAEEVIVGISVFFFLLLYVGYSSGKKWFLILTRNIVVIRVPLITTIWDHWLITACLSTCLMAPNCLCLPA